MGSQRVRHHWATFTFTFMDILSLTKQAKIDNEEKQSLQQVVLGKLDSYVQKNEIGTFPNIIHKNKLKMD